LKTWIKAFLMFLLFLSVAVTWIIGIILVDFKFFILGLVLLSILTIYAMINLEELKTVKDIDGKVMEDERNKLINAKAGNVTYEIIIAVIVSLGVAILTLRDIYPDYMTIAYTLLLLGLISLVINRIAKFYYKRKYE